MTIIMIASAVSGDPHASRGTSYQPLAYVLGENEEECREKFVRWLVFEDQRHDGLSFDAEYASLEAIEAIWIEKVSQYTSVVAYGILDDEPLREYHLIQHNTGLPEGMRGRRVQVAWVEVVGGGEYSQPRYEVIKMVSDNTELHYTVPPPPGYYEVIYPTPRLEPIPPDGFRGTGMVGAIRVSDPL